MEQPDCDQVTSNLVVISTSVEHSSAIIIQPRHYYRVFVVVLRFGVS
jgi:hypothetical protein